MSPPSRHPISLTFLLTLLLLLATAAAAVTPLVQDTCNRTSSFSLCVEALSADPQTATATNKVTMVDIAFRLAITNATATSNYISDLITNHQRSAGRAGRQRLALCGSGYESAKNNMVMLSRALNDEDYAGVADLAVDAAAGARKCQAAFSKSTWQPMGNRNQVVVVLCEVIAVLARSTGGPGEVTD